MKIESLLADKTVKSKEKTAELSKLLLSGEVSVDELVKVAAASKDADKGTCIEALEYTTKQDPERITKEAFDLVTDSLSSKAGRVQWESAKVIGNTAHLFKDNLDKAIKGLLDNSEHPGTVVRWSAAFALGEILQLDTEHQSDVLSFVEARSQSEEKNSIRKIYQQALKKHTR